MVIDAYTHILPREVMSAIERLGARFGLLRHMRNVVALHDLGE